VDAGALATFAATVAGGPLAGAADRVLLTPHAGELARLLGLLEGTAEPAREDVEAAPYAHAARAAAATGATVLLKGATTLVVRPDGRARSRADGPPWLATAGAGDVLAGVAGALLAGGLGAWDAGAVATLAHGRAAARASSGGPIAAADVAAALPATVADLLAVTSRWDTRLKWDTGRR
jgi:NAD(P)H-hydrate repair Nnr-like enzyme with NAD(P)H-hydrate dehydratase domain